MRKMSNVCDYFVIASGSSTTQVRAIADHIRVILRARDQKLYHAEGEREGSWLLLDYGDVVAHIFLEPTRKYYDLERLWADAPQSRFEEKKPLRKKKTARKVARKVIRKKAKKKR